MRFSQATLLRSLTHIPSPLQPKNDTAVQARQHGEQG